MKKVILILVDGMRPDALMQCGHSYSEELIAKASYTLEGKTVYPSDFAKIFSSDLRPDGMRLMKRTLSESISSFINSIDCFTHFS